MAKTSQEEKSEEKMHSGLYEISRKLLLAAVGAAVIAQEETDHFINRLVEHGEIAEKDARKLMKEMRERREKYVEERKEKWDRHRTTAVSREDLEALNLKLADLTKQVEELKKSKEK